MMLHQTFQNYLGKTIIPNTLSLNWGCPSAMKHRVASDLRSCNYFPVMLTQTNIPCNWWPYHGFSSKKHRSLMGNFPPLFGSKSIRNVTCFFPNVSTTNPRRTRGLLGCMAIIYFTALKTESKVVCFLMGALGVVSRLRGKRNKCYVCWVFCFSGIRMLFFLPRVCNVEHLGYHLAKNKLRYNSLTKDTNYAN